MKRIIIAMLILLAGRLSTAQQVNYNWRIGVSGGFTNYYGDLSPYPVEGIGDFSNALKLFNYNEHYSKSLSGQVSLERRLTATTGLRVHYGQYHFGMSDRYTSPSGTLDETAPHFERALNFRTSMEDVGIALVLKADNGKLLPEKSFIAPYLTLGGGWMWYDVKGDLLDANDAPYDYSSPTVMTDGTYETDLSTIATESNGDYDTHGLYAALGIGFRIRLSNTLELFAQSTFNHAFTDYLDDVSGKYKQEYANDFEAYAAKPGTNEVNAENPYRGHKNGGKDWFIYHGAGIKLSFGSATSHFRAPQITSSYNTAPPPMAVSSAVQEQPAPNTDSLSQKDNTKAQPLSPGPTVTNNYYSLNWGRPPHLDQLKRHKATLSVDLEIMELQMELDSVHYEGFLVDKKLRELKLDAAQIQSDSTLTEMDKLKALKELEYFQQLEQEKKDLLDREATALQEKIRQLEADKESVGMGWESDSLAHQRYMGSLAQYDPNYPNNGETGTIQMGMMVPQTVPDDSVRTSRALATDSATTAAAPVLPMATMQLAEADDQAEAAESPEPASIAPTVEPEVQYVYLQPSEGTPSTTTVQATVPEASYQEEKQKRSWIPIPIIFGGNKNRDKKKEKRAKKNSEDSSNSPEKTLDSTIPWYEQVSEEDYQKYYLPAAALGMTTAGIFIAANDQTSTEPPVTGPTETVNTPIMTAPPQEASSRVDTVYLKGKDTTKLLASRKEIYFDLNQKTVSDPEKKKLEDLIAFLKENPESSIQLEGFADNTGNIDYNLKLVQERTQAVKDVLIQQYKVDPRRIKTLSGGQILRNPSKKEPNQSDRRVEVSLIFE
ncbi:OmpA family protein [Echinicola vietnamensis]|uniref:Outer membrane protein/peptidoglycan-associated (Lipo)protein n=1 Tax=Echinicola vietnamensis (strain DSM 17526 / LMG 23754 / KMM 6221) TaxID=926556 RepID=L0G3F4_ECHVK|nr:OmpA family protein [Echinicola vietnamensis]AGA80774.1 outer membrane protein/peptidoglycan-associated (lipo)protein [Echinicola vietnamensis DSM 17526]